MDTNIKTDGDSSFWSLIRKKSFMEKIVKLKNEKEVAEEFQKEGFTVTAENMEELKSMLNNACEKLKNCSSDEKKTIEKRYKEIGEDDLTAVAGGFEINLFSGNNIGSTVTKLNELDAMIESLESGQAIQQQWLTSLSWLGGAAAVAALGFGVYGAIKSYIQSKKNEELKKELKKVRKKLAEQEEAQRSANIKAGVAIGVGAVALAGVYAPEIKAWFKRHS